MARVTFTAAQKAEAMMLISKGLTGSEVCEKVGCSPASLQNWKKEYADKKFTLDDLEDDLKGDKPSRGRPKKEKPETWEDEEEDEEQPASTPKPNQYSYTPPKPAKPAMSREDFIQQYWRRKTVESVMKMPETIDEVVALLNNALAYAYDHLTD